MPFLAGKAVGGGALPLDRDECRRALGVLLEPFADAVELRPLPHAGGFRVLPAGDLDGLVAAAEAMCADGQQVYYTLNPVPAGLDHSARVGDVLRRRWFLVDVDPVKDAEHKDDSATDAEKERAGLAAEKVLWWLTDQGWPAPVVIDSGNGYHLLWRIDLEATPHSQALLKRLLYVLAERFDSDGAKIDRSVHNASRIAKLPGSWARKGENHDDRPWRPVRLMSVPLVRAVVSAEQIAAAGQAQEDAEAETAPGANGAAPPPNGNGHAGGFLKGRATDRAGGYGRAALEREVARVALAPVGERNNALNRAAFSLGQLVAGGELQEAEVVGALANVARLKGLSDAEIGPSIRSGLEAGKGEPRKAPEKTGKAKLPGGRLESAADAVPEGESVIILASKIVPRKIEWLWPGRIALGKLTTFAGVGGLGKTFVLCDISARVTVGLDWPDCPVCCDPGRVLFVSGEDEPDDTLVPRLIQQGANLDRVAFLRTEVSDRFTLADLKTLDRAVRQMGNDVRFVAIDPPTAYLGGVDDHKNGELRGLLTPLKSWAASRRLSVVFNTHVNKPQGAKVEAMMRVMGSVAWVNAVRAAHMFARDPDDRDKRLFIGMKLNVGKERKGLRFRLADAGDEMARVEWLGEVELSADEAMNNDRGKRKRAVVASEWLTAMLPADGTEVPSKSIWKAREETTLSKDAVLEAKEEMGIKAKQASDEDGCRIWVWYWPPALRQKWEEKTGQPKRGEGEF